MDPRIGVGVAILGFLGFVPAFILAITVATPGTKSPFQFLDRFWPPAIEAKKAKAAAAPKKVADAVKKTDAEVRTAQAVFFVWLLVRVSSALLTPSSPPLCTGHDFPHWPSSVKV